MSLSPEEVKSLVKTTVLEALKEAKPVPSVIECPDCHAKFDTEPRYLDHRVSEYIKKKFEEHKPPAPPEQVKPEDLVKACEGPLCKLIEDRYGVKPKEEEEEGSYKPPWRRG